MIKRIDAQAILATSLTALFVLTACGSSNSATEVGTGTGGSAFGGNAGVPDTSPSSGGNSMGNGGVMGAGDVPSGTGGVASGAGGDASGAGGVASGAGGDASGAGGTASGAGGTASGAGGTASGAGGTASGAGGTTGTGGTTSSAGGTTSGAGGTTSSAGGTTSGAGGTTSGAGGKASGAGGTTSGAGGTTSGAGGKASGAGGTTSGAGGTTGTGGTTGAATGGPCLTDLTTQAAIFGDSYVTGFTTPPLQPALAQLDPSLKNTPNYAVLGVSLATGGLSPSQDVPLQFASAIKAHPNLKFTIMDGGGNDLIECDTKQFPGCDTLCAQAGSSKNSTCLAIVQKAMDAAAALLKTASDAGVKDTVYFFYPHTPAKNGGYNEMLDYVEPLAKAACDGANAASGGKLSCWFVDLVQPFKTAFGDANPAYFEKLLGVHPTQPGVTLMAQQIFNTMKAHCVGFTAADAMKYGCTCTP
jgi:hypothetical protein